MLESVRNLLSGKTLFILVTFLAIPFVFFGSTSFGTVFSSFGTVNGETVSQTDVNLAASNVTQRYQSIFGDEFSIDLIGEEQYAESVRQEIINQKLLLSAARAADLIASEKQAKKEIIQIENFQTDGQFDEGLFQSVVRANGFTPDDYINLVQQTISMDFFIQGLTNSTYVSARDIEKFIVAFEKTRDVDFQFIDFGAIKETQSISDEQIKSFYDANPLLFLDKERRSLQFLTLNSKIFADGIAVDETLIKSAYEEYLAEQKSNVQRRASHLMVDAANYNSKDEALEKIRSIKAELDNGALNFADAVVKFSEDSATINSNGDLGYSAGFAFPEEFEAALGELSLNSISNIIDLEDTLHILKLTEIVEPEIKSYAESADELKQDYIAGEAAARLQNAIAGYEARILAGESFESIFASESFVFLNTVSEEELTQATSPNLTKEVFGSSALNAVAFQEEGDEVTFFTITEIIEPQLLTFDTAKDSAKDELMTSLAQNALAEINTTIKDQGLNTSSTDFQTYKSVTRYSSLLPREVGKALFQANLEELTQVSLSNGDVYWIKATNETLPDESLINSKAEQYELIVNQIQQQRYNIYLDNLLRKNLRVDLKNI